jgi:hypothetical protein
MFSSQRGTAAVWGLLGAVCAILFMVGGSVALVSAYEAELTPKPSSGPLCKLECRHALEVRPAKG